MKHGRSGRVLIAAISACAAASVAHAEDHGCLEWGLNACLQDGRFSVAAFYTDPDEGRRNARIKDALIGDEASLFWFFEFDNPELLVKVLNGCGVNGKYWVFGSAATDLKYSVEVLDLATGQRATYSRDAGNPLIRDTDRFPCRPDDRQPSE